MRSHIVKRVCIVAEAAKKVQLRPRFRSAVACFVHKNGRISIFKSAYADIAIEMHRNWPPEVYIKRSWLTATDVYEYI